MFNRYEEEQDLGTVALGMNRKGQVERHLWKISGILWYSRADNKEKREESEVPWRIAQVWFRAGLHTKEAIIHFYITEEKIIVSFSWKNQKLNFLSLQVEEYFYTFTFEKVLYR